jgi:hypothetical protein
MTETEKMIQDAAFLGTGVMLGGRHIPHSELYKETDRELLELAAKAYWGDEIDDVVSIRWGEADNAILYTHADNQDHDGHDREFCWNPLEQDYDALPLAVKLHMTLRCYMGNTCAQIGVPGQQNAYCNETDHDDPGAATRRAIVRAAAEVGKAMP